MPPAKRTNRVTVPSVEDIVANTLGSDEVDPNKEGFDAEVSPEALQSEDAVVLSRSEFEGLLARLEKAERPVLVKVKDVVVNNKRRIGLAAGTVVALSAAAYAVTHKDEVLEAVEHTTEKVAEKTEHAANDVKQDAREARTGSRVKGAKSSN